MTQKWKLAFRKSEKLILSLRDPPKKKKNMFSGCEIRSRISKFFFSISATECFSSSSSQTLFTFGIVVPHAVVCLERMGIYSKFYFVQTLRVPFLSVTPSGVQLLCSSHYCSGLSLPTMSKFVSLGANIFSTMSTLLPDLRLSPISTLLYHMTNTTHPNPSISLNNVRSVASRLGNNVALRSMPWVTQVYMTVAQRSMPSVTQAYMNVISPTPPHPPQYGRQLIRLQDQHNYPKNEISKFDTPSQGAVSTACQKLQSASNEDTTQGDTSDIPEDLDPYARIDR